MNQNAYWTDRLHQWTNEIVILKYKGRERQETGPPGLSDFDFKCWQIPSNSHLEQVWSCGNSWGTLLFSKFCKNKQRCLSAPPHNPFQGIVVSVTGAFWPTVPSVSVSDFTVRPWPDLYTGLPRNLFNPSGIILKSSHLLEGCIFKITLTQNIAPEEQNMNSHRVSELYDQTRWGPPTLQVSCWPLIARLCLGLWICLESGGCCSGSRGVRHMWMCLPVPLPSPLIPCLIFNSVA